MTRSWLPRSLRGLPRETFVLALVAFCVALGFGIVVPAVPLFALQFGVSSTAAGAVVSAFALMRLLSGLGGGRLVDRVGERVALLVGLGVVAISSLLAGLSVSYPQLLILRGVGGIGSAVFTIAATSLLLRVASAAQRGQTQSVYRGGFLLGGIIGPAFGGAVIGFSLRAPFFLYAGTLALAMLAAATLLPKAVLRPVEAQVTLGVGEDDGVPEAVVPVPRTTLRQRWPARPTGPRSPATSPSASASSGCAAPSYRCSSWASSSSLPAGSVRRSSLRRWCRRRCCCPPARPSTRSGASPCFSPAAPSAPVHWPCSHW